MIEYLVIGTLCTGALTELVRHDGRLTDFRVKMETLDGGCIQQFLKGVMGCGWCLSHWMALITSFGLIGPYILFPKSVIALALFLIAFALACTRGANIVNDTLEKLKMSLTPQAPDRESRDKYQKYGTL